MLLNRYHLSVVRGIGAFSYGLVLYVHLETATVKVTLALGFAGAELTNPRDNAENQNYEHVRAAGTCKLVPKLRRFGRFGYAFHLFISRQNVAVCASNRCRARGTRWFACPTFQMFH